MWLLSGYVNLGESDFNNGEWLSLVHDLALYIPNKHNYSGIGIPMGILPIVLSVQPRFSAEVLHIIYSKIERKILQHAYNREEQAQWDPALRLFKKGEQICGEGGRCPVLGSYIK